MKYFALTAVAGLLFSGIVAADDLVPAPATAQNPAGTPASTPAPTVVPPTHVDTTVVGSSVMGQSGDAPRPSLDNNHGFVAGEPDLLSVTKRLKLSPKQQAQLRSIIESSDAGAGVLIEREHDVQQMIAAATPEDPMYAKLINDQAAGAAQWTQNRESLRRAVLDILTPAQQKRFEELQAKQ
jgi:Spy/CpxP family protein refolding chaperone